MKGFIEKLIGKLEEQIQDNIESCKDRMDLLCHDRNYGIRQAIKIAKDFAEQMNVSENLTSSKTTITNADKIRAMDDSELAGWISNLVRWSEDGEAILSIWDASTKSETRIHDSCGDVLEWLQSEVR